MPTSVYTSSCIDASVPENNVYYRFQSEIDWKTLSVANDTWEHVRYLLENHLGFQQRQIKNNKKSEYAYIEGFYFNLEGAPCDTDNSNAPLFLGNKIQDQDFIKPGAKLILKRLPMPEQLQPFIPEKFQVHRPEHTNTKDAKYAYSENVQSWYNLSEAEKLHSLVNTFTGPKTTDEAPIFSSRFSKCKRPGNCYPDKHASTIVSMKHAGKNKPRPHYVCHYCGQKAQHFYNDCPYQQDPLFRPLFKRKLPSGIPLCQFRPAQTAQEKKYAYICNGQYLVWKS